MIGVSSTAFSAQNLEETIAVISKHFKHWEIFGEAEHDLALISARLMILKDSYNLSYSVHSPISETNVAALSERMREASVLEIMATMENMALVGVKMITIHPGLSSLSIPGQEDKAVRQAKKSMRSIERAAQDFGIRVAVENMPNMKFMLGREAAQLAEIVDGTSLGVCFDIGHANTTNQIDEMIETFGNRITNIHIHDNDGDFDSHMTIGDGSIDFSDVLKKLRGYGGNLIIESKDLPSAVESQERLRDIIQNL